MRPIRLSDRGTSAPPSPIRKLVPIADQARARGVKVWGLNIGQPDIVTPERMWDAGLRDHPKVLAYSPSPGIPELRSALAGYYEKHGIGLTPGRPDRDHRRERGDPLRVCCLGRSRRRGSMIPSLSTQTTWDSEHAGA